MAGLPPNSTAISHLGALRRAGLSDNQIAGLSGISTAQLRAIENDASNPADHPTVAAAILSTGFTPTDSRRTTPAVGARRRARALMVLGWSLPAIADHTGFSERELRRLVSTDLPKRVSTALWWAVYDTFEALSGTIGPNRAVRDKAVSQGWAAPLAWDDDEIDHPDCGPHMPTDEPGVVDEIAVERVLHDEHAAGITLNKAEIDAVLDAYVADKFRSKGQGQWTLADLARMLDKTEDAAERQLTRWRSKLRITLCETPQPAASSDELHEEIGRRPRFPDERRFNQLREPFEFRWPTVEQDQVCRAVS